MPEQTKHNSMAAASQYAGILTSICAVLFFLLGTPALLLAVCTSCLSILFAHLSKGGGVRFSGQAIAGIGTSVFSLVVCVLIMILAFLGMYMAIRLFGLETALDPEALQQALYDLMDQYMNSFTTGGAL